MRRPVFAVLCACGAALAVATGGLASTHTGVTAAPRSGTQHTTFIVNFTAPHSSGHHNSKYYEYFVAARGAKGRGCRALISTTPTARAGQRVSARLVPQRRWCSGDFSGHVYQIEASQRRGVAVRIRVLGKFSFHVNK